MAHSNYQDWRITLRLLGPLGSPMQSDTLFGHLCWQVAFDEGPQGVARFLEPFAAGSPPFVFSDAFPAGLLPRPLLPRKVESARSREQYAAGKRREKAPWLTEQGFLNLVAGRDDPSEPLADPWIKVKTPHAAINRLIDTTGDRDDQAGQFYHTEAWALPDDSRVQVYLRAIPEAQPLALDLLKRLSRTGFGRDKSTGYGHFAVESCAPCTAFGTDGGADAFVSLSTFMPAADDPTDGRWRLRIKRGYLGEHAGAGNPFKRPLVQLLPGAVFRTGAGPVRPVYGRMVGDVAPGMREAVQCGYSLAAPCHWREI